MLKVLVIEDEPKVSSFIRQGLEENGYEVEVAFDGMLGLRFASTNNYDIILLDIIIPLINGIELCRKLREINAAVPVLMLTALGTTKDKVDGLEAGADDYLVKPFEFDELLARIKSLTRRTKGLHETSKFIKVGDLTLDMDKQLAKRDGKTIILTAKEFSYECPYPSWHAADGGWQAARSRQKVARRLEHGSKESWQAHPAPRAAECARGACLYSRHVQQYDHHVYRRLGRRGLLA